MYLYHYYDKSVGPFRNLSDVSVEEAKYIMQNIKETKPDTVGAKRSPEYIDLRRHYNECIACID